MSHIRQQLREIVAATVTGLATTGTNVFQSRVYPMEEDVLPCLLVYTTGDEVIDESIGSLIGRRMQVVIEGKTKAATNLDDTLDAISEQVEVSLGAPVVIAGQSTLLDYEGCEISMEESDRPAGIITMRYSALIYTQRTTPSVLG